MPIWDLPVLLDEATHLKPDTKQEPTKVKDKDKDKDKDSALLSSPKQDIQGATMYVIHMQVALCVCVCVYYKFKVCSKQTQSFSKNMREVGYLSDQDTLGK